MLGALLLLCAPAQALTIIELARYERPEILAHVRGSLAGVETGFSMIGNRKAAACVKLWAAPTAAGTGDSKALTDILTRFADELATLRSGTRPPDYEQILAAAVRKQCGTQLPSAR